MAIKREEKALREFKHIIHDILFLLRSATGVETAYMHWINRTRMQFVLETHSTLYPNVVFQDRLGFEKHFLSPYKDLQKTTQFEIGKEIQPGQLRHYYQGTSIQYLTIIPFVNNSETVALTVLESENPLSFTGQEEVLESYNNALTNVLNTYLELTDLYDKQQIWTDYEESMSRISPRLHKVDILSRVLEEAQKLLPAGGVCLIARGMNIWTNVLVSEKTLDAPPLGLMIEENSIAYDALQKGSPEFAIHFNQNPKRLATGEPKTEGATLAIPVMIDDRRHGVVVAYDRNAMSFQESTKHQLINLVRIASLSIRINLGKLSVDQDLLTSEYGSFIPDVWERALETEIKRARYSEYKTWFGMLAIENLQQLRSRYRLEELQRLQRNLVQVLNPSRFGITGYIGFHSDYIFTFILQGEDASTPVRWMDSIRETLKKPVVLSDGQEIEIEVKTGYTEVSEENRESYEILQKAKSALSESVKPEE
ncbi:MAG: GAF domain-containing protein [Balneolaceae bacterium]